jgi:hypothetical protein
VKDIRIGFSSSKVKDAFIALTRGDEAERRLHRFLRRAFDDLRREPSCGIKIPRKLWPKEYAQSIPLDNLWKYDLPGAWRLVYSIKEDEVTILAIILEWLSHKEYERRFKY